MDEKVKYWIDTARYDYDTAVAMLQTKRYLYVGFMCQQTIEKELKACIAKKGEFPPKIHNLAVLAEKAEIYDIMPEDKQDLLDELNPLNIEARYPLHKDKMYQILTDEVCNDLIDRTEELMVWIEKQLFAVGENMQEE